MRDPGLGGAVGLVDVYALDGPAHGDGFGGVGGGGGGSALVVRFAADGVVEDEDFGGARAVVAVWVRFGVRFGLARGEEGRGGEEKMRLRFLEQFFSLWVVNPLDLVIVEEFLLSADMLDHLEALGVQSVLVFRAADIVHHYLKRLRRSEVCFWLIDITWRRRTAIFIFFEVIEGCDNIARLGLGGLRFGGHSGLEMSEVVSLGRELLREVWLCCCRRHCGLF